MVGPVVVYLAGVVTGPIIKPVARGTFKGTIKAGLRVKKLAGVAASELHGLAAEAGGSSPPVATPVTATVVAKK